MINNFTSDYNQGFVAICYKTNAHLVDLVPYSLNLDLIQILFFYQNNIPDNIQI